MLKQIWQLIPHRLFYFLILGLIISYGASFILEYLTKLNYQKVNELKDKIENIKSQYSEKVGEEAYQSLMQFLSLKYLIEQKKSILPLIQQPPKYLPKFIKINQVSLNNQNNQVKLAVQINGWVNYARMVKYFESQAKIFKDFKIENFSFDNSSGLINANLSFIYNIQ